MKFLKIPVSLLLISIILSLSVSAGDDAPPALPTEFWGDLTQNGNPVPDGLNVTAEVDGVNYAQASVTNDGKYNVLLVNGDRELTYNNDRDCSWHWNETLHGGEKLACVPCVDEADCIEGPQDGALVKIKVDNNGIMPFVNWLIGLISNVNVVTPIGDWDKAGCVSTADIPYFANHYGEVCGDPGWNPIYDIVKDCVISTADITVFANHYGEGC